MSRYTEPKNRVCRRFGVNIFGRARNPLVHKPNPAGMHGSKRKKKSDYGVQLEEKQKLKAVYGMLTDSQLSRYFQEAAKKHQDTPELLMQRLECRLDMVVFRLKMAPTIFAAQQIINHGHILVDGKKVDRRSFFVKPGMVISIKEKSKQLKLIADAFQNGDRTVPEYLEVNEKDMIGKLLSLPSISSIPLPMDINIPMICDFVAHAG